MDDIRAKEGKQNQGRGDLTPEDDGFRRRTADDLSRSEQELRDKLDQAAREGSEGIQREAAEEAVEKAKKETLEKAEKEAAEKLLKEAAEEGVLKKIGKGIWRVGNRFPVVTIGSFCYIWNKEGFGAAVNDATWPVSALWD